MELAAHRPELIKWALVSAPELYSLILDTTPSKQSTQLTILHLVSK